MRPAAKKSSAPAASAKRPTTAWSCRPSSRGSRRLKRPSVVDLYTDSQYVGKGLTEWMPKWKANGWRRGSGRDTQPVKNVELWQQLDELFHRHQVSFIYVPGHSGHPENERCDMLAVAAYQRYL
ncbi:MAG: RNase H family protein [Pirellulales bacterium]